MTAQLNFAARGRQVGCAIKSRKKLLSELVRMPTRYIGLFSCIYALMSLSALTSYRVSAASVDHTQLAECLAIADDLDRLACFDEMTSGSHGYQGRNEVTDLGRWKVISEISPVDYNTNVYLSLDAYSQVSGWTGKAVTSKLVFRCTENKTEGLFVIDVTSGLEYGGHENATAFLRFDKEQVSTYKLSRSTSGRALFFQNAIVVAKKMMEHTQLLLDLTSLNVPSTLITFQLTGLAVAIQPLRAACHW